MSAEALPTQTQADSRAVRARRARLEADLIEEGASAATISRLATDETAAQMLDHERRVVGAITSLFQVR